MSLPSVRPLPGPERGRDERVHARLHRWSILAGFCALLFVVDLLAVLSGDAARADRSLELAVHGWLGRGTFGIFTAIAVAGGAPVSALITAAIAAGLALVRLWRSALLLTVAVGGGALLDGVVKAMVARSRPHLFPDALHATGYSFPSGHSMNAMIFFGMVLHLMWIASRRRAIVRLTAPVAALCVALIGLSRIVLGVHYPTDVVGGYLLGVVWLACVFAAASLVAHRWGETARE